MDSERASPIVIAGRRYCCDCAKSLKNRFGPVARCLSCGRRAGVKNSRLAGIMSMAAAKANREHRREVESEGYRNHIAELERKKNSYRATGTNMDYGIHPKRCGCGYPQFHTGRKELTLEERTVILFSAAISVGMGDV